MQKAFQVKLIKGAVFQPGMWKRKQTRKHLIFEEPEAEAFFIKYGAGMLKRLNFCGNGAL